MKLFSARSHGSVILLSLVLAIASGGSLYGTPLLIPPSDLNPGDQFYLAFLTDGVRDATSADIADYDAFVAAEANAIPALVGLSTTWLVIGSTQAVAADVHTNVLGFPVYRLDGVRIADNGPDLWDAVIQAPLNVTPTGAVLGSSQDVAVVWTGTGPGVVSNTGFRLGTQEPAYALSHDTSLWFGTGSSTNPAALSHLYGISGLVTVSEIPEPGTFSLLLAGMAALLVRRESRARRRGHALRTSALCSPR
jgi:PEP-CTERM motif-containing protein